MIGLFKIFDAHVHFYSNSYFRFLVRQKTNRLDINTELKNLATKGRIEIPGEDPVLLAKRWVEVIDKWKIERLLVFSSIPGDEDAVVKAVGAFPTRLAGFFAVDPNSNLLLSNAEKRLKQDNLRGIFLYPSLYHINIADPWLDPLFRLCEETNAVVYVQFGKLIIKPREFVGLQTTIDDGCTDPKDLIPVAKKYSKIRFVIPNFGAGRLEETLEVGKACPNVYVDTAGSNSWMSDHPTKPDLRAVFQKFLGTLGPGRILFGSDSGMFPRGYRYDIVDNQTKLIQEMRVPLADANKIFYENAASLVDR